MVWGGRLVGLGISRRCSINGIGNPEIGDIDHSFVTSSLFAANFVSIQLYSLSQQGVYILKDWYDIFTNQLYEPSLSYFD